MAGGSGIRMNAALPKQFMILCGKPVLMHTLQRFYDTDPACAIILVLPREHRETWQELVARYGFGIPHILVDGGETRFHSVKNGLARVQPGLVAVHDGVRPLVSSEIILACFRVAGQYGAVIPVIPVYESVRSVEQEKHVPFDREKLRLVQTPQCFRSEIILRAFEQEYRPAFTDCASVVEAAGYQVLLTEGNRSNIKITTPEDLQLAKALLGNTTS